MLYYSVVTIHILRAPQNTQIVTLLVSVLFSHNVCCCGVVACMPLFQHSQSVDFRTSTAPDFTWSLKEVFDVNNSVEFCFVFTLERREKKPTIAYIQSANINENESTQRTF